MYRFQYAALLLILGSTAFAQPIPRLTVLTPPGGQAGTTVQLTLAGADLDTISSLMISPAGIIAESTPDPKKAGTFLPNQFTLKIPKDMPSGIVDIRAVGTFGITNPRSFVVGELPESQEKEPNNDVGQAQPLPLNSTMNGVIQTPADVDYFAVACKKGETVIVQCATESIDSKLEPDIRVFSKSGRLLVANRPRAEPDGFCQFTVPADGTYLIRLCSHAHVEGSAESFYRLSVSTRPWIEAMAPNVVEPGKAVSATIWGRNLVGATQDPSFVVAGQPLQKLAITLAPPSDLQAAQQMQGYPWLPPARAGLDGFFYRTRNQHGWSNAAPVFYSSGAVVMEKQDHGSPEKAQAVTLPCDILGRIERQNDRDWYSFSAKAGEVISLEGFAERAGIPLDLYFELRSDKGNLIGEYDDHPDVSNYHRFACRTDDPCTRATIPADGKYLLMVSSRDATLRSDPRLQYRVAIHKPRPDFRAVALDTHPQNPGSIRLVPGGKQHLDMVLFRREGFTGPVTCMVEGLPAGITCTSMTVPAGSTTGAIVFAAADKVAEWNGTIRIQAKATIDGNTVTREVRAGCLVWPNPNEQNNGPGISRLCRSIAMAVRPGTPAIKVSMPPTPINLPIGGNTNVKLKIDRTWPESKVPLTVTAVHLPPGVVFNNNQPLTIPADKADIEARLQIQPASTSDQFPLILRITGQVPYAKDPQAKQKPAILVAETSSAVPVSIYREVVAVADFPKKLDVQQGKEALLAIKLKRLNDFLGAVNVQVQGLPTGVTLSTPVIAEKATEAKWVVKAGKNAQPAADKTITIRLTGTVNGINLVTEQKLLLNIVK